MDYKGIVQSLKSPRLSFETRIHHNEATCIQEGEELLKTAQSIHQEHNDLRLYILKRDSDVWMLTPYLQKLGGFENG
jgi:hypothetical protein